MGIEHRRQGSMRLTGLLTAERLLGAWVSSDAGIPTQLALHMNTGCKRAFSKRLAGKKAARHVPGVWE